MFIRIVLSILCFSIFFTGCVTKEAASLDSAVSVPQKFEGMQENTATAIETNWWTHFGSQELDQVVRRVIAQNPDLRITAARVEAAQALATMAGAEGRPSLAGSFDARRQQQNFIGLPIPGQNDRVLTARSTSYGVNFVANWELDVWGRIRAGRNAARKEVEAAQADFYGAQLSLVAQTVRAWFAVAEANRQLELARLTAENLNTTAAEVKQRYASGLRSSLDLRLASAAAANASAVMAARSNQVQIFAKQLSILQGDYPSGKIEGEPILVETIMQIPVALPGELLERRPDIVRARHRAEAANFKTSEAKRARLPRLALTTSGGRSSSDLEDLLSNNFNIWALAANVTQPIYEGGRLKANVDLNEARSREAYFHYVSTALAAFSQVERALSTEVQVQVQQEQLMLAVEHSRAAAKLAEERYRRGLEGYITLLEAQRRLWEIESQLIANKLERLNNRVALYMALGGGYDSVARISRK